MKLGAIYQHYCGDFQVNYNTGIFLFKVNENIHVQQIFKGKHADFAKA